MMRYYFMKGMLTLGLYENTAQNMSAHGLRQPDDPGLCPCTIDRKVHPAPLGMSCVRNDTPQ